MVGTATVRSRAPAPCWPAAASCPRRPPGCVELLAPALLAALVATHAFASDEALVLDERGAGLAAAGVAVALKAPLLVVIVVAAVTAALLRAIA